ncbi:hypothetical protein ACIRD9_11190 [Streptomyces violaceus]|uniref:hypothetical protein n=1 Tax=Streptomyces violaceus TaxID=1936 RepID=UPI00381B4489
MPHGYAVTLLVAAVNALSIGVCTSAAYVLARTPTRVFQQLVLMCFVAGMFVPTQVILIPVIFVLRGPGLMGTLPGLILFLTATTIPFALFGFVGSIRMLPGHWTKRRPSPAPGTPCGGSSSR